MAKASLTKTRVDKLLCPADKAQAFLWDSEAPGLGVRVTRNGKPAFIFQGVYAGSDVRITIGKASVWKIPDARVKARELQRMIDQGRDPRDLKREALAERERRIAQQELRTLTVGIAWQDYMDRGRPKHKKAWKPRYKADMVAMASAGGEPKKRGKGNTRPGPLHPLLSKALVEVTEDVQKEWFEEQAKTGHVQAARAYRILQAFLGWCLSETKYRDKIDRSAISPPSVVRALPPSTARHDLLEKEQIGAWWAAVESLENRAASTYLLGLLLTGARREELAALKWEDVSFRWRTLTIADKVDATTRTIPLTPYLAHLLTLIAPKNRKSGNAKSGFVFTADSRKGWMSSITATLDKVNTQADIGHVTVHGLRRTFKSMTEWLDLPVGVVAQIMGHKPSATAEKHYTRRPVSLLAIHHTQIEKWMLEQAGVKWKIVSKHAEKYPDPEDSPETDEPQDVDFAARAEYERHV
jgi:integrase